MATQPETYETRQALSLQITNTGDSPILDTYMKGYEKVFTLPDESEDRDGFAACLAPS